MEDGGQILSQLRDMDFGKNKELHSEEGYTSANKCTPFLLFGRYRVTDQRGSQSCFLKKSGTLEEYKING